MTFYFAWADKEDTTFSATEHAVQDEDIFAFIVRHSEGDFPSLELDLRNPRVGMLGAGRKQWAWLSWDGGATEGVAPLFFGRLVGVPQGLQDEIVRLTFVARPADYDDVRETLAASLRVAPYYSSVWLTEEDQRDPDRVLEGYSKLWHIDRVTHDLTVSDIVNGEDGVVEFDRVFHDSLDVSHDQSPVRKVSVQASVRWSQRGTGSIDITQQLINAFHQVTPPVYALDGSVRNVGNGIAVIGGEELMNAWPEPGRSLGAGWSVAQGTGVSLIGPKPLQPTLIGNITDYNIVQGAMLGGDPNLPYIRQVFDRQPGLIVQVVDYTHPQATFGWIGHRPVDFIYFPIWRIAPTLNLQWEANRDRSETVTFDVAADVQPLLTDPGDEETVRLTLGPVDVDVDIYDVRSPRFFQTAVGTSAFENLLARARAIILSRARAVNVQFEVPFEDAVDLTCRMSGAVFDPRLPGGEAGGKIIHYAFGVDGDSGQLSGSVTLGCCVGHDGEVVAVLGDPTYVDEGYVNVGYQVYTGGVIIPFAGGSIGYDDFSGSAIDDDGLNFLSLRAEDVLQSLTIEGGLESQQEELYAKMPYGSGMEMVDVVNNFKTAFEVQLLPVAGGPFETTFTPNVYDMKVPRTIDLEAT